VSAPEVTTHRVGPAGAIPPGEARAFAVDA
jgi:hypothetical protein